MENQLKLQEENYRLRNTISQYKQVARLTSWLDDGTLKGGYRVVKSIQERDAIDSCHRKIGMIVSVQESETEYTNYRLIKNNTWIEVTTDGNVPGQPGPPGEDGEAATIDVGTVITVEPDEPAVITNTGTPNEAIFDFEIPRGQDGESATIEVGSVTSVISSKPPKVINVGSDKDAIFNFEIPVGADGKSATLNVGTVTTVDSNESATITNTGTDSNAIFNFEIPKGEKGDRGDVSLLNFNIDTDMHLIMNLETNTNLNFTLDNNGHLILLQ